MEFDWLKQWNIYSPHAVAIEDVVSGRQWTYRDLYYASGRLAQKLSQNFSIGAGDRVATLSKNHWAFVPLFFALQRLGATLVPINFRLAPREIDHIVQDSEPRLMIYSEEWSASLQNLKLNHTLSWSGPNSLEAFLDEDVWLEPSPMGNDESQLAMILYTSGTTGAPKGAMITRKMLFWNSLNTSLRLNLTQNDVTISFLPFFHTSGWNVLLTPFLHRGAKTVLLDKFEPEEILNLVEKTKTTILFGVPTMLDRMAQTAAFERVNLSSVRYAIVGGEPMPVELIQTWLRRGIPVRQGYGLTEFGPNVFSLNEEDSQRKIGSIGFPNFYIEAKIVGASGDALGANQIGELALKGPTCSLGYWRNPKATAEAIQDGWFYTGDLVRRDDEGYYYVVGRKKDMFISGGENVYPAEVEKFLLTHPAIAEAAVVGVQDEMWGEVGKAFVVCKNGHQLTAEDLKRFSLGQIAKYKIPKYVEVRAELPKGDTGKILKRALLEPPAHPI